MKLIMKLSQEDRGIIPLTKVIYSVGLARFELATP